MAEQTERDGRTEAATPRRLQKAREEGTVLRAHGAAAAAVTVVGAAVLSFVGGGLVERLEQAIRLGLSAEPAAMEDPRRMLTLAGDIIASGFGGVMVFLTLLAVVGFAADVAIGGWVFSSTPLQPDFSRINPITGFGRLFSRTAFAEIVKSLVKFVVLGVVAAWLGWHWADALLHLASETWPRALQHAASVWSSIFIVLAACLIALAVLELPYQVWAFRDRLKMTREEIREEARELEGSPQTRRRIRTLRQRLARMRMMSEVPKANVVVVNPEHYAAALSYRPGEMRAPRATAKGTGLVAMRIRELAAEHDIPIVTAPRLARAIFRYVDLGDEIPAGLYPPVAEVLAYVYRLRAARDATAATPPPRPPEGRFDPPAEYAV